MHRTQPAPRGRPTSRSCTHLLPESGQWALLSLPCHILAIIPPPASKYRTPANSCTPKTGQQVLPFIQKSRSRDRRHLHPNIAFQRSSASQPSIPTIAIHSISCPSHYLHLQPNVASHQSSSLAPQYRIPEIIPTAPQCRVSATICTYQLLPPLVHPTSCPNKGFATRPHFADQRHPLLSHILFPLTTIPRECQTFALSVHPTSRSSNHLYLHPILCADNRRHPHPSQISFQQPPAGIHRLPPPCARRYSQPTSTAAHHLPPTSAAKSLRPSHIAPTHYAHPCILHITTPCFLAVVQQQHRASHDLFHRLQPPRHLVRLV